MKPTLLVLAAGMGSRYGGLKQFDCLGPQDQTIMDYSVYDAVRAGFGKIVFVIRHDFEEEFNRRVLSKYKDFIPVEVVYQELTKLPEGYTCPADRTRPWGTNHAIMTGGEVINEPFAVINADDFYGLDAFEVIADELSNHSGMSGDYCMVGFEVGNTMTENGSVSRGVCRVADGLLAKIVERKAISYDSDHNICFTDEKGVEQHLEPSTPVSMNLWGFGPDYFRYSEREFCRFLDKYLNDNGREFFIPSVVDKLRGNGEANVKVLHTSSKWFGVTYADDRSDVIAKLAALHAAGVYPDDMFGNATE